MGERAREGWMIALITAIRAMAPDLVSVAKVGEAGRPHVQALHQ
jgi:hypothetical protein